MNKNVIALAVAAAMAAPLAAQAEVKITGGLQAQVVSIDGDASMPNGLYATDGGEYNAENSGNYGFLKFAASEDLGNGLTALAVYSMNVHVGDGDGATTSAGTPGGRDSYVGLSGGFGTVLAGTITSPYASSTKMWDPMIATFAQARGNFGMSALHNSYAGNALAYANKFGPATVVAAVVLDEAADDADAADTSGDHAMSFSVNVPVGPVEVAVAYLSASDFGTKSTPTASVLNANGTITTTSTKAETGDYTATKVGVKYNAGAITVAGQFETLASEAPDDTTVMYLTGSYAMGANTFSLGYGITDDGTDEYTYTAIGMKHAFSKTTSVNVAYRMSDDGSDADLDETAIGAGLRVAF
jgi:predicted porin